MKLVIEFEFPNVEDSRGTEADKILEKIGNINFEDDKLDFYWKVVGSSN
jgi:hypothetical protein